MIIAHNVRSVDDDAGDPAGGMRCQLTLTRLSTLDTFDPFIPVFLWEKATGDFRWAVNCKGTCL